VAASTHLQVEGTLPRETIAAVGHRNRQQFHYCYARAHQPQLAGAATLRFRIGREGAVQESALVSSTLASPELERCLAGTPKVWLFPKVPGGGEVWVTYPLNLSPGDE
jgi:hypothetical protein